MLIGFANNIRDIIYAEEIYHRYKICRRNRIYAFCKVLNQHNENDETLVQYLPKSNPRHQRPSLKAENGRDIRDGI